MAVLDILDRVKTLYEHCNNKIKSSPYQPGHPILLKPVILHLKLFFSSYLGEGQSLHRLSIVLNISEQKRQGNKDREP